MRLLTSSCPGRGPANGLSDSTVSPSRIITTLPCDTSDSVMELVHNPRTEGCDLQGFRPRHILTLPVTATGGIQGGMHRRRQVLPFKPHDLSQHVEPDYIQRRSHSPAREERGPSTCSPQRARHWRNGIAGARRARHRVRRSGNQSSLCIAGGFQWCAWRGGDTGKRGADRMLFLWSLILMVSVKYVLVLMQANNRGEGGLLALLALLVGERTGRETRKAALRWVFLAMFGTAMLYGDGVITPAISVLSAVEGLHLRPAHAAATR